MSTEFFHREYISFPSTDKHRSFSHGGCVLPRHGPPPYRITNVLPMYPVYVLPMCPVRTRSSEDALSLESVITGAPQQPCRARRCAKGAPGRVSRGQRALAFDGLEEHDRSRGPSVRGGGLPTEARNSSQGCA
jgi:hypothetical protein